MAWGRDDEDEEDSGPPDRVAPDPAPAWFSSPYTARRFREAEEGKRQAWRPEEARAGLGHGLWGMGVQEPGLMGWALYGKH